MEDRRHSSAMNKFTSALILTALTGIAGGSTSFALYLLWDNTKRITALETQTAGYIARNDAQHTYMLKTLDDIQSYIKAIRKEGTK